MAVTRNDHRNALAGAVAGLAGAIAIGVMEWLSVAVDYPLAVIPFATSIVLVIGSPGVEPAQPRALIGGHVVSALVGLAVLKLTGPQAWAAAAAVGLSIAGGRRSIRKRDRQRLAGQGARGCGGRRGGRGIGSRACLPKVFGSRARDHNARENVKERMLEKARPGSVRFQLYPSVFATRRSLRLMGRGLTVSCCRPDRHSAASAAGSGSVSTSNSANGPSAASSADRGSRYSSNSEEVAVRFVLLGMLALPGAGSTIGPW